MNCTTNTFLQNTLSCGTPTSTAPSLDVSYSTKQNILGRLAIFVKRPGCQNDTNAVLRIIGLTHEHCLERKWVQFCQS